VGAPEGAGGHGDYSLGGKYRAEDATAEERPKPRPRPPPFRSRLRPRPYGPVANGQLKLAHGPDGRQHGVGGHVIVIVARHSLRGNQIAT
jgi:hypothetical protein